MRLLGLVIGFVLWTSTAIATPDPATWRRQTLMGENADYFFRYVSVTQWPASYYSYHQTLELEKVRKSDVRVVERIALRDVHYSQNLDTDLWTAEFDSVMTFDLATFLRVNAIHPSLLEDLSRGHAFLIDSAGVWQVVDGKRELVVNHAELYRQIPGLGGEPRVVDVQGTSYLAPKGGTRYHYIRIRSNRSEDDDWSEDLLLIPN